MVKRNLLPGILAMLVAGSLHLQAEQKQAKPPTSQGQPVAMLNCPDVAITSLNATLVSTLLGDLQVEFPMDTVKLEAKLESVGSAAIPQGTSLYLILKKNGRVIQSVSATDILGAPGSRWTYSVNDSFTHNQKTNYAIQVASTLKECRVSNNQATHRIDEKKLHPAGNPDLTVSILAIEKHWKQEESQFQAFFELAAAITNNGSGASNSSSRLLFVQNEEQVVLASLPIAQEDLPGPGQTKHFSTELAAIAVPPGEFLVSAHIERPGNEFICNNNWSLNTGQISNFAEPPAGALAVMDFQPWHLAGKNLSATLQITNLQNRHLRDLRLILLRDNIPVKEWKALACGPRAQSRVRYQEELQPTSALSGSNRYRAVLYRDAGKTLPADNLVLAAQARSLYRVVLSGRVLQKNLQDKDTGLAVQIQRQNKDFRIQETLARIHPGGILIQVKGNRAGAPSPGTDFQSEVLLLPSVALGRVELETIKTDVRIGSGSPASFATLLAPIIRQTIRAAMIKIAEKELGANLPANPAGLSLPGSRSRPPLGILLVDGALDIYY